MLKNVSASACLVAFGFFTAGNASTLVNDFSGTTTGYGLTSPFADYYAMSSPSASPTATGGAGQVDVGYFTVNYRDMPFFTTGEHGIVEAYTGAMGSWSGQNELYSGGNYFDPEVVTGFLVSLRQEVMNDAGIINFYILSNQDLEYFFPIHLSVLPTGTFSDIFIDLANASNYTFIPGLGAAQIGIRGDWTNPSSTYHFSIDSLRSPGTDSA